MERPAKWREQLSGEGRADEWEAAELPQFTSQAL